MHLSTDLIEIVECHAEGEVGDVVVAGVEPPPGETVWAQSRFIADDDTLRQFLLNEPRGGVFRHCNLLVPPKHPDADIGFIIMEPADTPPMSGSNAICVSTVALECGIVEMTEPETYLTLEAPGGLVPVVARCKDGKVLSVTINNVPSFAHKSEAALEIPGIGTLSVSTAYGGDSFVVVDAAQLGFNLVPEEAGELAALGVRIAGAATEQLGFAHPEIPDWRHVSFCLFTHAVERVNGLPTTRHAVAIRPGKIDRSPTGTGVSARLALLHARNQADTGDILRAHSIIDSEFVGRIERVTAIGDVPAIIPSITGRAWITGRRQLYRETGDPWPTGYRIADTWPAERN